jgi:uridine kinase
VSDIGHRLSNTISRPLSELTQQVAHVAAEQGLGLVGITGPSAVGKSVFASGIAREIWHLGRTAMLINGDDFLASDLRGGRMYRASSDLPLTPGNYDFFGLSELIAALRNGRSITRWGYSRGSGWTEDFEAGPADVYVVEGLFLDSVAATKWVKFDLLIVIEASWDTIADLRRQRDASIRDRHGVEFRLPSETEEEIRRTREAYLAYVKDGALDGRIVIEVDSHFHVRRICPG